MSWFDSSFNFAKTAINQAQKSIDRVLDISEEQKLSGKIRICGSLSNLML